MIPLFAFFVAVAVRQRSAQAVAAALILLPLTHFVLGFALESKGDIAAALSESRLCLEFDPTNAKAKAKCQDLGAKLGSDGVNRWLRSWIG